jgi:hypothetical protein
MVTLLTIVQRLLDPKPHLSWLKIQGSPDTEVKTKSRLQTRHLLFPFRRSFRWGQPVG